MYNGIIATTQAARITVTSTTRAHAKTSACGDGRAPSFPKVFLQSHYHHNLANSAKLNEETLHSEVRTLRFVKLSQREGKPGKVVQVKCDIKSLTRSFMSKVWICGIRLDESDSFLRLYHTESLSSKRLNLAKNLIPWYKVWWMRVIFAPLPIGPCHGSGVRRSRIHQTYFERFKFF